MRSLAASLALTLWIGFAVADPVTVPDGQPADLKVAVPKGASVVWRYYPPPIWKAADLPPGRAIFAGKSGTTVTATAIVIDFKSQTVTDTEFEVVFGKKVDPPPPPGPNPPPTPDPTPDSPFPGLGLRVLVVYEKDGLAAIPPAQLAALHSTEVNAYLSAKCPVGADGKTPDWRKWDKDQDVSRAPAVFRDAFGRKRGALPWVVIGNGKSGYEGPLPGSPDEFLALLKKFGG